MWTTSAISAAGRLTIPQALRDRLRLRQGSKVHMQELADGVVIISTRPLTSVSPLSCTGSSIG